MKKIILIIIFILNFNYSNAEDKIAYININYILNNSSAGISITEHIQKMKDNKKNEFLIIEKQLAKKEKEIVSQKNILEKSKFNEEVNKLREEVKIYNEKKKAFNEEIKNKKLKYTKIILNELNSIISNYVEKNSISLVFPKKNIIIAKKNLDITDQIIVLLNKKLTKINF
tara:strand:+ start:345 stop:857 length:513 start_codon:yes stop_codon:yes gene_type:complete